MLYNTGGNFIKDMMSAFLNSQLCCLSYFVLAIILSLFSAYAYYVNSKRPTDDPLKKKYYVSGIFTMPFIWPLLLVGWIMFFVLKATHFGFFLLIFTLSVVFIRKPFWLPWLEKIALKIGGMSMNAYSGLMQLTFGESPVRS
ncbi:MAG: hypothetical protein U0V48_08850 [Anaerolineales bacterium]